MCWFVHSGARSYGMHRLLQTFGLRTTMIGTRCSSSELARLRMDYFYAWRYRAFNSAYAAANSASVSTSGGRDAWRFPIERLLNGNEVPLGGGMGERSGHVVGVARLIKAKCPTMSLVLHGNRRARTDIVS